MSEGTATQRAGLAVTLLAVTLTWACGKSAEAPTPPPAADRQALQPEAGKPAEPPRPADPVTAPEAQVEIVLFSDFQCPFCQKVNATLADLKARYGDTLRVTFMHQPLAVHKQARSAAIAAEAARKQGKFWPMHDELFAHQRNLRAPDLERYALKVGLDMERYQRDTADPAVVAIVDRHQAIANAVGATSTPYFFVNGKELRGAQEADAFVAIITEELASAGDKKGDEWLKARLKENHERLYSFLYEGAEPPPTPPQRPPVDKTVYKATVDPKDATRGPADAPVTLVVFSEFQCPYCKKLEPVIQQLFTDFPDKLRLVFKHSPLQFHKDALPASLAALCAKDQGRFWELHDLLWEHQQALAADNLTQYAGQVGLDMEAFKTCLSSQQHNDQVAADQELAQKVTARGTPTTFVNGRKIVGARAIEEFKDLITEELAKAEAMLARGVPADKLYEEIIKDGKIFEPLGAQVNNFDLSATPLRGKADARIQIVAFADFQCPFSARVVEPLKALKAKYGDELVVGFKHFPLAYHSEAAPAAAASMCAHEQGKFWEYHDQLFANMASLQPGDLKSYAKTVGLDETRFAECVDSNRYQAHVDSDMKVARDAGVRGTPSIYINGRKFTPPGGYTVDSFTAVIEKYVLSP